MIAVVLVVIILNFYHARNETLYAEFVSVHEGQEFEVAIPGITDIECCYNWCKKDTCHGFVYRYMENICHLMQSVYTGSLNKGTGSLRDGRVLVKSEHLTNTLLARGKIIYCCICGLNLPYMTLSQHQL